MSRYIDIDDISLLKTVSVGGLSAKALWKRIRQEPSIDLVFCEECKRRYRSGYRGDEYWVCDFMDAKIKDDDFCSYGCRKESE